MEITPEQFAKIEHGLHTQCGNVSLSNLQVLNAILGCKYRGYPSALAIGTPSAPACINGARLACWIGCSSNSRRLKETEINGRGWVR